MHPSTLFKKNVGCFLNVHIYLIAKPHFKEKWGFAISLTLRSDRKVKCFICLMSSQRTVAITCS